MQESTILIVDDTVTNIDVLTKLLQRYDPIATTNAEDALDILKDEAIDLILLDIMMPGMDGYQMCQKLKNDPNLSHIPIIFITAKGAQDDIQKGFELGAVDYITKPFNPTELLARVNTHLELNSYRKYLEQKVQKQLRENRLKQQLLHQHSKQAAIGELLMHIAHQWKQPLSELGAMNLYTMGKLQLQHQFSATEIEQNCQKTEQVLQFMSQTIETFQNFYKPTQKESFFTVAQAVDEACNIVSATFEYFGINLCIHKKENPKAYGNANEYAQVILNILNNAKDIFLQNKIKEPTVTLTVHSNDQRSLVTIEDNGGGFSDTDLDTVFTPFCSGTKSTGLGLYMSKTILEKNGGCLQVQNDKDGALFSIYL
ncbi:MAG: response regulator [Campylobacterota bacterium]